MKDYELLNMIGEVNEDYVLAAGGDVVRPRFRWRTIAACAACAALAFGAAYPAYLASFNKDAPLENASPFHEYIVMDGGGLEDTRGGGLQKAPAGDADGAPPALTAPEAAPEEKGGAITANGLPAPPEAAVEDVGPDTDGDTYWSDDVAVQEASLWYDALLSTMRLEDNPEWFGGAWIAEDRLLAVAIVDGFRTPELEEEIQEAAGEGAALQFSTVKYSMEFLNGLMEPAARALEGSGLCLGVGVDVRANCLGVDLYGEDGTVPDSVLAALAHLDPDGDAIRVRVFAGTLSAGEERLKDVPVPGGADQSAAGKSPQAGEEGRQARYDLLPQGE